VMTTPDGETRPRGATAANKGQKAKTPPRSLGGVFMIQLGSGWDPAGIQLAELAGRFGLQPAKQ